MSEIVAPLVQIIRIVVAVSLICYLPGTMLVMWLFPPKSLNRLERFVLGVMASLCIAALTAYVLAQSAEGLTPQVLAFWLLEFMLIFLAAAALRWHYRPQQALPSGLQPGMAPVASPPNLLPDLPKNVQSLLPRRRSLVALVLALVVVAAVAFTANSPAQPLRLTEFYLAPLTYQMDGVQYTRRDNMLLLPVVVVNHENRTATYRIEAWLDEQRIGLSQRPVLMPGERWAGMLEIPLADGATFRRVDLLLYLAPENGADSRAAFLRDNGVEIPPNRAGLAVLMRAGEDVPIARLRLWLEEEFLQEGN